MHDHKKRALLVERAHRYLEQAGRPRLVMLGVLAVTLASGFLASVAMVHLGVDRMSIRYPLAVAAAYAMFLGLLWGWLQGQGASRMLADDPEGLLVPGVAAIGGAALSEGLAREEERRRKNSSSFSGLGSVGDVGEGFGPLVILVLIAGACTLIVSLYLIVTSPALLAELVVDGALLGAMSRAIGPDPAPHWSRAVLRRTWPSALVTAIVFGLVGFGIERVAPGARTLGEAWTHRSGHR